MGSLVQPLFRRSGFQRLAHATFSHMKRRLFWRLLEIIRRSPAPPPHDFSYLSRASRVLGPTAARAPFSIDISLANFDLLKKEEGLKQLNKYSDSVNEMIRCYTDPANIQLTTR